MDEKMNKKIDRINGRMGIILLFVSLYFIILIAALIMGIPSEISEKQGGEQLDLADGSIASHSPYIEYTICGNITFVNSQNKTVSITVAEINDDDGRVVDYYAWTTNCRPRDGMDDLDCSSAEEN